MSYLKEISDAIQGRESEDAAALAAVVFPHLSVDALKELVAAEIANIQRNMTRERERVVFAAASADTAAFAAAKVRTSEMRDRFAGLFRQSFAVGGEHVMWGRATIAQHEARAEMLEKLAAGNLRTANQHREAAEVIRNGGVTCLEELGQRRPVRKELLAASA